MGNLFGLDTPVGKWIVRICDLIFLNVIYILCCIPVVTIGAANCALCYVTLRMQKEEEGGIAKDFFYSFRQNFKQSVPLTLIFVGGLLVILLDIYLFNHMELGIWNVCVYVLYVALAAHCILFSYVFPVFSRYENSVKNTLKNSGLLAIQYPLNTVVVSVVSWLPFILNLLWPELFYYIAFLWLFVMFALQAYWNAGLFRRIFVQLEGVGHEEEPCN